MHGRRSGRQHTRAAQHALGCAQAALHQRRTPAPAAAQEAGLAEQRRAFEFFDRDRDARVTLDDFAWAMEQLGLTGEGTVGLTKARPAALSRRQELQDEGGAFSSFSVLVSYVPFAIRSPPHKLVTL